MLNFGSQLNKLKVLILIFLYFNLFYYRKKFPTRTGHNPQERRPILGLSIEPLRPQGPLLFIVVGWLSSLTLSFTHAHTHSQEHTHARTHSIWRISQKDLFFQFGTCSIDYARPMLLASIPLFLPISKFLFFFQEIILICFEDWK